MGRRNIVRIVSFSLAVILSLFIYTFKTKTERDRYLLQLQNGYSRELNELCTSANNMSVTLEKLKYLSTRKKINDLAFSLLCEAEISKNAISQLPVGNELRELNKYLSQIGNYAKALGEGKETNLTQKEAENIKNLSSISSKIAEILNNSRNNFDNLDYWSDYINDKIEIKGLEGSFEDLQEDFKDYPTLIYDGPYSNHILNKKPEMLKNAKTFSKNEAKKIALKWTGLTDSDLDFAGETKGNIPAFDFYGAGITVSVTKKGGFVLNLRKQTNLNEIKLNHTDALARAREYLRKMEMFNFKTTYYYESDGICTVNFAYQKDDVTYYTDLVKVGVSMEDGDIVFYESGGYIANHKNRSLNEALFSIDEAEKIVSQKLKITNKRKALIPTNNVEESLCYEFTCVDSKKKSVLIYINTATLEEEEILLLLKSDGGVLTK